VTVSALWIRTEMGHRYHARGAVYLFAGSDLAGISNRTLRQHVPSLPQRLPWGKGEEDILARVPVPIPIP
jgi:hypothetical protein